MLADPNEIWLGAEHVSDGAAITFANASLTPHDDTDTIDPSTFTEHWSLTADFAGGTLTLADPSAGTDLIHFRHTAPHVRFQTDVDLSGKLTGVNIADGIIQLSALGSGTGDVSTLQFRATSSDLDEVFEFDRAGNSDYSMFLHRGGSRSEVMTDSHDILREGDNPYPSVENNGTAVHSGPSILDFGDDITASDSGSGEVLIEYTGGTVPGRVHDDGTEILADANGLDFLDYLDVTIDSGNNFAQIAVNDTTLGVLGNAETVTGAWTFDAGLSLNAGIDIATSDSHLELSESDTAEPDYWEVEVNGSAFNVAFYDDSAATTTKGLAIDANQNVNVPNGLLSEQGDRVATQAWTTTTLTPYADTTSTETISAAWTHEDTVSLTADTQLQWGDGRWQAWHSTTNNDLYIDEANGTPTTIARFSETGVNFPQGASSGGNTVATETWVGSNYASPSVSETVTAQWSFDQQIQGEAATAAVATDANALGGNSPAYYAALSEAESVTGGWAFDSATAFNSAVTVNATMTNQNRFELLEDPNSDGNDGGLAIDVGANRVYIAPYDHTLGNFEANKQITYDPDGAAQWNIEGAPLAGGETIATQTWVNNNVSGGNLSANEQETITAQWTFDVDPVLSGFSATPDSSVFAEYDASNSDATLWHVGNDGDYGYSLTYIGSGTGNANYLDLTTDNETSVEDVLALRIDQAGTVDAKQQLEEAGERVATRTWTSSNFNNYTDADARNAVDGSAVSITGDAGSVDGYDIQVNGTDGPGIINFKT